MRQNVSSFVSLCFALLGRGFTVKIRPVARASFVATVYNGLDSYVGEVQWRDPIDESTHYAQGLSFDTDEGIAAEIAAIYVMEGM